MRGLSGRQKRHLRSLGQQLQPLLSIGKAGLTEAVIQAAGALLDRQELLKVRLPPGPAAEREALADRLAQAVAACRAGLVGRNALLYRPNGALPPARRVALPPD